MRVTNTSRNCNPRIIIIGNRVSLLRDYIRVRPGSIWCHWALVAKTLVLNKVTKIIRFSAIYTPPLIPWPSVIQRAEGQSLNSGASDRPREWRGDDDWTKRTWSFPRDIKAVHLLLLLFPPPPPSDNLLNFAVDWLLPHKKRRRNGLQFLVPPQTRPLPLPRHLTWEFEAQSRRGCRTDSLASVRRAVTGPVSGGCRNRWRRETLWSRASVSGVGHRAASSYSPLRAANCAIGRKT